LKNHETYIKRCLQIANNGLGTTRPNPMVGAVIVHKNHIISEGFTDPYGSAHAEVNAINGVKDKSILNESTIYVTLEPCSHYGKTPPCSDLIIKSKIPKVVIGCIDDNPQVAGRGIKKLRDAGVEVIVGVLENECKTHHKRFFTFYNKKRPYIVLKWAETKNGFIAPTSKDKQKPVWITNSYSRQLVHRWRAEEQAILVGTNTVMEDNPNLTVRDWTGENPIRVVLDRKLKLQHGYHVTNNDADTIFIVGKIDSLDIEKNKEDGWLINPVNSELSDGMFKKINWDAKEYIAEQVCEELYKLNVTSIIIEGGAKTIQTFINEDLWDEARVFTGNVEFNDGIKAPVLNGKMISKSKILNDTLRIYVKD